MRISDWSSDVCSSDLAYPDNRGKVVFLQINPPSRSDVADYVDIRRELEAVAGHVNGAFAEYDWAPIRYLNKSFSRRALAGFFRAARVGLVTPLRDGMRSEEHTSELQSLMRISYAVFCLKTKIQSKLYNYQAR